MELKGKLKEDFEKWFIEYIENTLKGKREEYVKDRYMLEGFYELTNSMQWGVIQSFADSVGCIIDIKTKTDISQGSLYFYIKIHKIRLTMPFATRAEAREEPRARA